VIEIAAMQGTLLYGRNSFNKQAEIKGVFFLKHKLRKVLHGFFSKMG